MRNLLITFVLISVKLFLSNCQLGKNSDRYSSTVENEQMITIDLDNQDYGNTLDFSTLFKGLMIIPLETTAESLIGSVNSLEFYNETIFVLDNTQSKAVFAFDINGNFIRRYGAVGRGPGEYISPLSFTVNELSEEIYILDHHKLIVFSLDGTLKREITFDEPDYLNSIVCFQGIIYRDHFSTPFRMSNYLLSSTDNQGAILNKWMANQDYTMGLQQMISYGNSFSRSPNDVKYNKPFSDTIFVLQNNIVKPFICFDTKNKISANEMQKLNSITDPMELTQFDLALTAYKGVTDYLESNNLIYVAIRTKYFPKIIICPKTSKVLSFGKVNDDLTRLTTVFPRYTFRNYFVSVVDANSFDFEGGTFNLSINKLISNVKSGLITLSDKDRERLIALDVENCNPVLLLYECKDDIFDKDTNTGKP
jgi:hypothetical protein